MKKVAKTPAGHLLSMKLTKPANSVIMETMSATIALLSPNPAFPSIGNSIQFNSIQFNSIQFNSIQFNSILIP